MSDKKYCEKQELQGKINLSGEDDIEPKLFLNFYSKKVKDLAVLSLSDSPLPKCEKKVELSQVSDSQCCH
jgi:hypothetical protein